MTFHRPMNMLPTQSCADSAAAVRKNHHQEREQREPQPHCQLVMPHEPLLFSLSPSAPIFTKVYELPLDNTIL